MGRALHRPFVIDGVKANLQRVLLVGEHGSGWMPCRTTALTKTFSKGKPMSLYSTVKSFFTALLVSTQMANAQSTRIVPTTETTETKVQKLVDREEAAQLVASYAVALDQKDWTLYRSVFTDEIQMDFSASIGDGIVTIRADDWVDAVKPFFYNLHATQHISAPQIIRIDGDEGYVRSLLHAQHFLPNKLGHPVQTMIGYYDNYLRRTEEGWKIYKVVQTISWNEGNWYVFEKAAGVSE